MTTPIALTIAGSDSGGGAGIQADLKTFSALGVYGASVVTALTAQNTCAVTMVEAASPAMIAAQMRAVFDDLRVDAVKLGMLGDAAAIGAVADGLRGRAAPVVLDPVMVAKSGAALLAEAAVAALVARLLPACDLLTPNLPEAARLLGGAQARGDDEMIAQGMALRALGARAVLMKGGHGAGPVCADFLIDARRLRRFPDRRAGRHAFVRAAPRHPQHPWHRLHPVGGGGGGVGARDGLARRGRGGAPLSSGRHRRRRRPGRGPWLRAGASFSCGVARCVRLP